MFQLSLIKIVSGSVKFIATPLSASVLGAFMQTIMFKPCMLIEIAMVSPIWLMGD